MNSFTSTVAWTLTQSSTARLANFVPRQDRFLPRYPVTSVATTTRRFGSGSRTRGKKRSRATVQRFDNNYRQSVGWSGHRLGDRSPDHGQHALGLAEREVYELLHEGDEERPLLRGRPSHALPPCRNGNRSTCFLIASSDKRRKLMAMSSYCRSRSPPA